MVGIQNHDASFSAYNPPVSPMSKTSSKKGSEDKWGDCSNVSKTIEKQGIEGRLVYCDNGPMGVISPMPNTSPKLGSEGKWRY